MATKKKSTRKPAKTASQSIRVPKGARSGTCVKRNGRYYQVIRSTTADGKRIAYMRKCSAKVAKMRRNPDGTPVAAPAAPGVAKPAAANPRRKKCKVTHRVKCNPKKKRRVTGRSQRIFVPGLGMI